MIVPILRIGNRGTEGRSPKDTHSALAGPRHTTHLWSKAVTRLQPAEDFAPDGSASG